MAKPPLPIELSAQARARLAAEIKRLGRTLGFQQVGITEAALGADADHLARWLAAGRHGAMHYMGRLVEARTDPGRLMSGTLRVISARMDYWPAQAAGAQAVLDSPTRAYLARYALGRDYHKILRRRLRQLAAELEAQIGPFGYRVCVDSAPVLEKALARDAGLGWIGKHTNLINHQAGSWFVLGELLTDLPLPTDAPATNHCGSCRACLDICPTRAIVAPYELDARRCISYLTIELKDAIPVEFRRAIGNRIFGCDDCQLVCPWNKFSQPTGEKDFSVRHGLDDQALIELFGWTEERWSVNTAGSAIRRAGYRGWLRNLAIALGNAPTSPEIVTALQRRCDTRDVMVLEHVEWALQQHQAAH